MAQKTAADSGKKIIDIAHPGKSAPTATSKPVLVSNRPLLKDPMVVDEAAAKEPETTASAGNPSLKPKLHPLGEDQPAKRAADGKPAETEPTKDTEVPAEVPSPEEVTEDDTTDTGLENIKDPASIAEEDKAKSERQAAVQKLVDNKQYFLPINSVEKRRAKHVVILGLVLSLVLAAAWADVALDAGLIKLGDVKPVTHFFST